MSAPEHYEQNTDYDIYAPGRSPQESVQHPEYPPSPPPLSAAPYYLPNVVAAIAASVGIVVGSVGPWASLAWATANGATASAWWQGKTTLILGAVAGIALFTLLNRARTGSGTRWLAPLAWIAPVAALVCLLIAIISIVNVTSNSHQFVGLQVEWGLWLVAISAVVLCATASVAAAQVSAVTEGSQAWMRTAIVVSALILLGVALFFSTPVDHDQLPTDEEYATDDQPGANGAVNAVNIPSPQSEHGLASAPRSRGRGVSTAAANRRDRPPVCKRSARRPLGSPTQFQAPWGRR